MTARRAMPLAMMIVAGVWLSQTVPAQPTATENGQKAGLQVLEHLTGFWRLTETHFDETGRAVATVKGTEENRWILDDRAIHREYSSGEGGSVYRSIGIIAFDETENRYEGAWFDNHGVDGAAEVRGEWQPDTRTFIWSIEVTGPGGVAKRFRRVERLDGENDRVATTFELDGKRVIKRVEVHYERAVPCPSGNTIRPIMDDSLGQRQGG